MARMNWDRVRKESQARRSGSEWVGSDGPGLGPTAESKPPSIRKASFGRSPLGRIPGCACKKTVGFVGQHKKFCPLRKNHGPDVHPRTDPDRALGGYPECIKKQLSAVSDFISSLQSQVNADRRMAESCAGRRSPERPGRDGAIIWEPKLLGSAGRLLHFDWLES